MKVLLPGVSTIVRLLGCKRACLGSGNLFLFGVYLLLCEPCSVWKGAFDVFPCLWDFNSYQELKIIIGIFFLSFFLSEIYLLLWEPSFVGTRVSAFSLFYGSFPRNGLSDGWLTIESHFSCYKSPPHTHTEWESHLTWLSEMGVTFDLSLHWLSRNGSYTLTQCHALLPTVMHVIFELGFAGGYFDSAKTCSKNLHRHFHMSLVFDLCDLCDFVSFDTVGHRGFFFLLWWTFALLCPKINNLRIGIV